MLHASWVWAQIFIEDTFLFNILFNQSISDVHCGLKIFHRDVLKKIKLSINDFGFELDIATQIIKNNFYIYEVGISYFSRTRLEGKKITWVDGLKAYYYLFKLRLMNNNILNIVFITIFFLLVKAP